MLTFQSDLTAVFVEGFSQDITCLFQDGYHNGATDFGSKFISMSDFKPTAPNEQPTSGYWMRLRVDGGVVANDSITNGALKAKKMVVFVMLDIVWHEDESSKLFYETFEPALDSLYLNLRFRGADGSEIYNQQDVVKDGSISRPTGGNPWTTASIVYPFVVRYF